MVVLPLIRVTLLAWLALALPVTQIQALDDPEAAGYRLTFEDTFDRLQIAARGGTGLTWYNRTPWDGDFGEARFAGSLRNGTFSVDAGVLTISMRKQADGTWTSGLIASMDPQGNGFAQQYGYFEIRAKLPAGEGVWPAFWLIGAERLEPGSDLTAEIDIMEHYGAMPAAFSAKWHVWHRDGSGRHEWGFERKAVEAGALSRDFHRYGVLVTEERTTFFFNGAPFWSAPTPPEHRQPMMVLANLGLGGGWPVTDAADGAEMLIDYIRVYAKD